MEIDMIAKDYLLSGITYDVGISRVFDRENTIWNYVNFTVTIFNIESFASRSGFQTLLAYFIRDLTAVRNHDFAQKSFITTPLGYFESSAFYVFCVKVRRRPKIKVDKVGANNENVK